MNSMTQKLFVVALLVAASSAAMGRSSCAADQAVGEHPVANAVCKDSEGGLYSTGAVVPVRGELMKCVVGPHWVPMSGGSPLGDASSLDVTGVDVNEHEEARIVEALKGTSFPSLQCDAVLNSALPVAKLLRLPPRDKLLVNFWTPTCGSCKPL